MWALYGGPLELCELISGITDAIEEEWGKAQQIRKSKYTGKEMWCIHTAECSSMSFFQAYKGWNEWIVRMRCCWSHQSKWRYRSISLIRIICIQPLGQLEYLEGILAWWLERQMADPMSERESGICSNRFNKNECHRLFTHPALKFAVPLSLATRTNFSLIRKSAAST